MSGKLSITPGLYRHYKGPEYEVLGLTRHSESEEVLVLYRALYGDFGLWVRPIDMFTENVSTEQGDQPRFRLIEAREPLIKTV